MLDSPNQLATHDLAQRRRLYLILASALAASLAIAPFLAMHYDMVECWLPWARASGGSRPWWVYRYRADCNYPPLVPELLTVIERLRHWLRLAKVGPGVIALLKLPNIAAYAAGVPLCRLGLRRFGSRYAMTAALCWALCIPLLINAAVWGQWDTMLSLAVMAAVLAALNDRPAWAGAAAGLALSLKVQAIVFAPTIGLYLLRRYRLRGATTASAAALAILLAVASPMLAGRQAGRMWQSYGGAVDYSRNLTAGAFNIWYLVHMDQRPTVDDRLVIAGPLTAKRLGLLAMAAYTIILMLMLWRRPTPYLFLATSAMIGFAFFMLPTQIHERYLIPAIALMALLVPLGWKVEFIGLCITTSLNQLLIMINWNWREAGISHPRWMSLFIILAAMASLANILIFIMASLHLWRTAKRLPAPAARPNALAAFPGQPEPDPLKTAYHLSSSACGSAQPLYNAEVMLWMTGDR